MSAAGGGVTAVTTVTPVRWGEVDAARLTPPAVSDPRGRAMVETVAALLRETPLTAFLLTDPWTVDARALPALLAAAGVSDLIEPGLPELHARALLAEARAINERRGRVAGIRWALQTVGLSAEIVQWHQRVPKGPPNTYEITIWAEDQVIPDGPGGDGPLVNAATQRQAFRLVDATKRWSQQGVVRIAIGSELGVALVGAAAIAAVVTIDCVTSLELEVGGAIVLVGGGSGAGIATIDCIVIPLVPMIDGGPAIETAYVSPAITILGMPGVVVEVVLEEGAGTEVVATIVALDDAGRGVPDLGLVPIGTFVLRARTRNGTAASAWVTAALVVAPLRLLSTEEDLSIATEADDVLVL